MGSARGACAHVDDTRGSVSVVNDAERRFWLYERTVLSAAHEAYFVVRAFADAFARTPTDLREDFAGTAAVAVRFVRNGEGRRATAVDKDAVALAYGERVHKGGLSSHVRERIRLVVGDVCAIESGPHDVIHVGNASHNAIKDPHALADYFTRAYARLGHEGLFIVEVFGGTVHTEPGIVDDETRTHGVVHRFHSAALDPVTRGRVYFIDFVDDDGTVLDRAFTYDWRMWTLDELEPLLRAAGFADVSFYVEPRDAAGAPAGEFARVREAPKGERFVCYLVGVKRP
jgi:hypothetical protein